MKVLRKCKICDKEFYVESAIVKYGKGKYCSQECQWKAQEKPRVGVVCENCGKTFYVEPAVALKRRYCGRSCAMKADNPQYLRHNRERMSKRFIELNNNDNPMKKPECQAKRHASIKAGFPHIFMGVHFMSKLEMNFCKYLVDNKIMEKPISGENVHISVGTGEVDFRVNGIFIELHVTSWWDGGHKTIEHYAKERREFLDNSGFGSVPLCVVATYHWNLSRIFGRADMLYIVDSTSFIEPINLNLQNIPIR